MSRSGFVSSTIVEHELETVLAEIHFESTREWFLCLHPIPLQVLLHLAALLAGLIARRSRSDSCARSCSCLASRAVRMISCISFDCSIVPGRRSSFG